MPLTDREKKAFNDIKQWESRLLNYEANDLQLTYRKYVEISFSKLPDQIQKQFFSLIDNWLFHLHGFIQGSQLQIDAKERILSSGRIFKSNLHTLEDMRQLEIDQLKYIAEQQISRHRVYSFIQGGVAGTGSTLLLGTDVLAMAVINLRIVQLIAMTYGFEVHTPNEMMTSLKVFHTATLPPLYQKEGWLSLINEAEESGDFYFYEGSDEITDISSLQQPMQQLFKVLVIVLLRKKLIQGIPLMSMAIGAGANYQLTRKVTDFAHKFYQLRHLMEKEGEINE